jgi:hypothetical protein
MKNKKVKVDTLVSNGSGRGTDRRKFLQLSGLALAGTGLFLVGCEDDDGDIINDDNPPGGETFDLGSGNLGILNYAFALEQLEAAFYTKVVEGSYWAGAPSNEKQIIEDTYEHEVIHREFFRTAISAAVPAEQVLPDLEFDFSSIDFGNRDSVLNTAVLLEDTGVAAYNGAAKLISTDETGLVYLTLAGKIVSVEARHASAFRNLVAPGTDNFASANVLVDLGGSGKAYDKATPPADVLAAVSSLNIIVTPFTAKNLPTS